MLFKIDAFSLFIYIYVAGSVIIKLAHGYVIVPARLIPSKRLIGVFLILDLLFTSVMSMVIILLHSSVSLNNI